LADTKVSAENFSGNLFQKIIDLFKEKGTKPPAEESRRQS
jgi:hypothetical protein